MLKKNLQNSSQNSSIKRITVTIEQDKFHHLEEIAKLQYRSISSYFSEWIDTFFVDLRYQLIHNILQAKEDFVALEKNNTIQAMFGFKLDELAQISEASSSVLDDDANEELIKLASSFLKKLKQLANFFMQHYQISTNKFQTKHLQHMGISSTQLHLSPSLGQLFNIVATNAYTEDNLNLISRELVFGLKAHQRKASLLKENIKLQLDNESNNTENFNKIKGTIKQLDFVNEEEIQVELPCLGLAAAGKPMVIYDNWDGQTCQVPKRVIGKYQHLSCYVVEVRGSSMEEEDILDGDKVIIHHQENAENGQIIVALVDNKATLKKLKITKNKVQLLPCNKTMSPITVDTNKLKIRGILIHNLKQNGNYYTTV